MRIRDISQPLGNATATWPGDRPFELDWPARIDAGASINLAAVALSVHTGTHVDGTLHFDPSGRTAGEMPLEAYIGPAVVVDAVGRTVLDADLLDGVTLGPARRVLFRTRERVDAAHFPAPFAHMTSALAAALEARGVRLVGTDAPSVDPVDSKTLDAHHALGRAGVAILENVVLEDVPAGHYFLVALPLRLVDADSSPVRAVLIEGITQAAD
jgi:arylformamidase